MREPLGINLDVRFPPELVQFLRKTDNFMDWLKDAANRGLKDAATAIWFDGFRTCLFGLLIVAILIFLAFLFFRSKK